MRKILALLLLALCHVCGATVTTGGFARIINASSSAPTIVLGSDVPANAIIVVGVHNRTDETTTLDSISDPVNGTWTSPILQGPTDSAGSTFRTWIAARTSSAALTGAGNRTLTINLSATISTQIVAGWISSDLGAMTFDQVATAFSGASNDTNLDSNTIATPASRAGVIIGFAGMNNAQSAGPTMDGAGETNLVAADGSSRAFAFSEIFATNGTYGFETTLGTAATANLHVASFLEPSAASSGLLRRRRSN